MRDTMFLIRFLVANAFPTDLSRNFSKGLGSLEATSLVADLEHAEIMSPQTSICIRYRTKVLIPE